MTDDDIIDMERRDWEQEESRRAQSEMCSMSHDISETAHYMHLLLCLTLIRGSRGKWKWAEFKRALTRLGVEDPVVFFERLRSEAHGIARDIYAPEETDETR
jgi:hypothetical protein